ncbi:MAG: amidohydrolase family protein [Eubacteriales bacterium]|nr:amidohydrolase family protein [Eubacteriales bacterium]
MFDLIILNGKVIDGTGSPEQKLDIAVKDGRIVEIGLLGDAISKEAFDAEGLYVTPGFIDMHSHSDYTLLLDGKAESFVRQGVTTEVIGNCGLSCTPFKSLEHLKRNVFCHVEGYRPEWKNSKDYFDDLQNRPLGINVVPLTGHAAIRSYVMGFENREASSSEIQSMKRLLEESMECGSFGFSTGLEYFPGNSADRKEIFGLCDIVKRYDGLYATHVRNRDEQYQKGYGEAFDTANKTGVRLQISHAVPKYGAPEEATEWVLDRMHHYGSSLDMACDVIPYEWGPTTMTAILPNELLRNRPDQIAKLLRDKSVRDSVRNQKKPFWLLIRDDKWDEILLYHTVKSPEFKGMTFQKIGNALHIDPFDAMMDLLIAEGSDMFGALMMGKIKSKKNIASFLKLGQAGVISDGVSLSDKGPLRHIRWSPGCYGWVPRFLDEYVSNTGLLTLQEAIHRITGLPAKRLGLKKRGLLKKDFKADITVFSKEDFKESPSTTGYNQFASGIKLVIIGGGIVIRDDCHSGAYKGIVLKKHID